ncbi:MAG: ATP-binding protein [Gemmatimonadetes bacterium]|nr:ATP-binding protein [Gemmatimonadota bacterium]MYG35116.1 ATP-binding protein [Gemmatimonadota bacterium]
MSTFQRAHVHRLLELLTESGRRRLIAITGPRQTGKTTIARQALAALESSGIAWRYVAVDAPPGTGPEPQPGDTHSWPDFPEPSRTDGRAFVSQRDSRWLVGTWQQARYAAERSPRGAVLVLDEIQDIHDWSRTVKGLWDQDQATGCPLRVVVMGSAPLQLMLGLGERLLGRFLPFPVSHWSLAEMVGAFDCSMDHYLFFGGYPAGAERWDDEDDWRSYIEDGIVQRNVERDILSLTRVDKPALLSNLLELGSFYSGRILSYNKMLGQLQDAGNTTTLARYLTLLSGAGLLAGLGNYSAKTHRRRASSPKLNVLNTALMTASSGYTFEEARADRSFWGRIVESAVGAHLYNTRAPGVKLYYWRRNGLEVDFVLARGPRLTAIEVKTGRRRGPVSGMEEFTRRFKPTRTEVVGTGGVALHEFLSEPASYWLEKER